MPKAPRRVFISYTAEDLKEFADRVIRVVQLLQWVPIDHRDWAPNGVRTVPLCRQQVKDSDIVVLLVAQRYGWIPPTDQGGDGKTSITQLEYQWAREFGKPVVPYLLADKATKWPRAHVEWRSNPKVKQPLEAFRAELREFAAAFFTEDPDSVTEKLQLGLQSAETLIAAGSADAAGEDALRRPTAAGAKRPDDLPYLCNRSPQSKLFRRTLSAHLASDRPRPLLFVVHGNADEAHHAFTQRVSERLTPAVLKEVGGVGQFRTLELEKLEPSEQASFGSELRALIGDKLMGSQRASDGELLAHLRESGLRGIVAVLQLRASEARKPDAVLLGVHDFWRNFPDLAPQQFVACVLSVTYQVDAGKGLAGLRALFGGSDANERMREAIRALEEEGRGDTRTGVYVLPELKGVTPGDVETWLGQVREWLPRKHIPEKKKSEMFNGRESICMDDAIEGLEGLLKVEEA
jgi:hypothetical protein